MRAVVAHGLGDFRLEDVAEPSRHAGAVIDVEAAGVCAADRMIWRGDGPWELSFPFTPGHEILGRVAWVDDRSAEHWCVGVGDRVTAEVMVPCRRCRLCRAGRENLCRFGTHLGSGLPGAFAERMVLPPEAVVHEIPADLDTTAAVLVEPAACATTPCVGPPSRATTWWWSPASAPSAQPRWASPPPEECGASSPW